MSNGWLGWIWKEYKEGEDGNCGRKLANEVGGKLMKSNEISFAVPKKEGDGESEMVVVVVVESPGGGGPGSVKD